MPDGEYPSSAGQGKADEWRGLDILTLMTFLQEARSSVETTLRCSPLLSQRYLTAGLLAWQDQILAQSLSVSCGDSGTRRYHDPQFCLQSTSGTLSAKRPGPRRLGTPLSVCGSLLTRARTLARRLLTLKTSSSRRAPSG